MTDLRPAHILPLNTGKEEGELLRRSYLNYIMSMEFGYGDWKSEFKHRRKPTRNCDQIVKSGETSVEPNWAAKSAQGVKDHGTRRHRRSNEHRAAAWFLIIVGVVAGASFYTIVTREISPTQLQQRQNKRASAKWRRAVQANCMRFLDTLRNQSDWTSEAAQKQKNRIDQWALNQFRFIDPSESQTAQESMPCRYAFLDWGLRDVQALGDWVELAMDACTPIWNVLQPELSWTHPEMPRPRFELSRMQVLAADSVTSSSLPFATPLRRYLHDWLWKPRASRSKPPTILPEEICMLGIGSDHSEFNELMRLERFIAGIQPPLFRSFEMEKVDKVQLNVVKKKVRWTAIDFSMCLWENPCTGLFLNAPRCLLALDSKSSSHGFHGSTATENVATPANIAIPKKQE